jgi:phage shock protein PspC (stress-responsive transcriptional regulator)
MNRRWVRSQTNRVIGGVAAGLADYLNADPALVRIAWALLVVVTGGLAFVAYLVAWVVVPETPDAPYAAGPSSTPEGTAGAVVTATPAAGAPPTKPAADGDNRAGMILGIGLVLVGAWFLVREYLPDIDWSLLWPIVLIAVGIVILVGVSRRRSVG